MFTHRMVTVRGLLFGDPGQLVAQTIGAVTNAVVVFGLAFLFFRVSDRLIGNCVAAEVESGGLDELEMGSQAYTHVEATSSPVL